MIIFLVDVKQGLTDADNNTANMLRKSQKPVVLVGNKVDHMIKENMDIHEFYNLGLGRSHTYISLSTLRTRRHA